jgi:hypothetical protein
MIAIFLSLIGLGLSVVASHYDHGLPMGLTFLSGSFTTAAWFVNKRTDK